MKLLCLFSALPLAIGTTTFCSTITSALSGTGCTCTEASSAVGFDLSCQKSVRIGQATGQAFIEPSVTSKIYFEPCGSQAKAGFSLSGSYVLGGTTHTISLAEVDAGAGADTLISVASIGSVVGVNLGGIFANAQISGNPSNLQIKLGLTACTGSSPSMSDCLPNPAISLLSQTFDISNACPTPAPTPVPGSSSSSSSSSSSASNSATDPNAKDAGGIGAGGIAGAVIASIAGVAMIAAAVVYKRRNAVEIGGSQQAEPDQVTQSATGSSPEQL